MWDQEFESLLVKYLPFIGVNQPLLEDTNLRDLGLDSMAMVELLTALEHTYEIKFRDDALSVDTFETPGRLWRAVSAMAELDA